MEIHQRTKITGRLRNRKVIRKKTSINDILLYLHKYFGYF